MMADLAGWLALFLLLNLLAALARVLGGRTDADSLLVALLFGTTGVAILLLLAVASQDMALVDVAMVVVLLASVSGVAFAQRTTRRRKDDGQD